MHYSHFLFHFGDKTQSRVVFIVIHILILNSVIKFAKNSFNLNMDRSSKPNKLDSYLQRRPASFSLIFIIIIFDIQIMLPIPLNLSF